MPKEVCSISKKTNKKYKPVSGCTKEPREICAPAGCGFKEGPEECFDKIKTVIQDTPKEQCSLEPKRTCNFVTKLVPKLYPVEECLDVPKEICTKVRTNQRKIKKPVVKKYNNGKCKDLENQENREGKSIGGQKLIDSKSELNNIAEIDIFL